jgi:hypothetical protein
MRREECGLRHERHCVWLDGGWHREGRCYRAHFNSSIGIYSAVEQCECDQRCLFAALIELQKAGQIYFVEKLASGGRLVALSPRLAALPRPFPHLPYQTRVRGFLLAHLPITRNSPRHDGHFTLTCSRLRPTFT